MNGYNSGAYDDGDSGNCKNDDGVHVGMWSMVMERYWVWNWWMWMEEMLEREGGRRVKKKKRGGVRVKRRVWAENDWWDFWSFKSQGLVKLMVIFVVVDKGTKVVVFVWGFRCCMWVCREYTNGGQDWMMDFLLQSQTWQEWWWTAMIFLTN